MLYLSTNDDRSVAVISVMPKRLRRLDDGLTIEITGMRRRDPKGIVPGVCELYGHTPDGRAASIIVGNDTYDISLLQADSIPGHEFEFFDIQKDCIDKWVAPSKARVVAVRTITKADLPTDRTFRDAWTDLDGKVEHDIEKARGITKVRLRGAFLRGRASRDLSTDPAVDSAQTVDELKAILQANITS